MRSFFFKAHVFFVLLSSLPFVAQKWAKQKLREKKNNKVVFNQATYDKLMKEVPKKLKVPICASHISCM